jgi:hypothetical protein
MLRAIKLNGASDPLVDAIRSDRFAMLDQKPQCFIDALLTFGCCQMQDPHVLPVSSCGIMLAQIIVRDAEQYPWETDRSDIGSARMRLAFSSANR